MDYYWRKNFAIVVGSLVAFHANISVAQISPDATLPNNSNVNLVDQTFNITGGTQTGGNLFHSFKEFSVPSGSTAFFNNGTDIQNIINRVTGGNISNIDGLIRANGSASVFLINPSGIVFGENARLDIGGSFVGTTADSMRFSDGTEFSAINPQSQPLLTVNVPLGLQYGNNPGLIQVQGNGQGTRFFSSPIIDTPDALRVNSDKTLALIGGDINLEGATLKTAGGRIELGSVGENSFVNLVPTDNGFTLNYSGVENFRDIELSQQANVDASGEGGGDIQVQGKVVSIKDTSVIEASTLRDQEGGDLVVNATELLELIGSQTRLFNTVYPDSTGNAGDLTIDTSRLVIRDGAWILTVAFGEGKSGNLNVTATDTIELIGRSTDGRGNLLSARANSDSTGDPGNLTIDTSRLVVRDGAQISAGTSGQGKGGNLNVTATDTIEVIGTSADVRSDSGLFAQSNGSGDGGDLTINTSRLVVRDGAQISAGTSGQGKGGNLNVTASESIEISEGIDIDGNSSRPSAFFAQSEGSGDAGDITIDTARLIVRDVALIKADTLGEGKGGNLNVTATETIELLGDASLDSISVASGDAGDITIKTPRLILRDGANVKANTSGEGNAGNLKVTAETIEFIGQSADGQVPSGLFAQSNGSGDAGDLTIDTSRLGVRDGAQISADTFAEGNGGNLNVTATDTIELTDTSDDARLSSGLFASSLASGDAGDLTIDTNTLQINQGGVSVESIRSGNAGNLNINANSLRLDNNAIVNADTRSPNKDPNNPQANININSRDLILRRNSNITTNADGKNVIGGNIDINSGAIALLEKSIISANSTGSRGGRVNIDTQGLFGTQLWYPEALRGSITATGATPDLSGDVQVNAELDPSSGLIELPVNVVDATNQISNACGPGGSQFHNEFVITGRGGLPMSPMEPLQDASTLSAWVRLKPQFSSQRNTTVEGLGEESKPQLAKKIVEATGWKVDKDGNIEFIADAKQVNRKNSSKILQQNLAGCNVSE